MNPGSARDVPGAGDLVGVAVMLAAYAAVRRGLLPDGTHFAANVMMTAVLLLFARWRGFGAADLGLASGDLGSGLRYGLVALAVVGGVIALGAALPATRGFFEDDGAAVGGSGLALRALVVIPIGTVLFEEVAFRGVMLGAALGPFDRPAAVAVCAVLFGLWHLPPLAGEPVATLAGTFAATAAAGVAFAWLRLASASLVAPMLAHLATNSLAFVAAWVVESATDHPS